MSEIHSNSIKKKLAGWLTGDDTWGQEGSSDLCGAENKELGHEVEPSDAESAKDNVVHTVKMNGKGGNMVFKYLVPFEIKNGCEDRDDWVVVTYGARWRL